MRRSILLLASALGVVACSPEFDPASRIEKLRVLAVRAEPPEIDPAGVQTAALTSLVVGPDVASTRVTTVVHIACVPAPGQVEPSPCVMMTGLGDPTQYLAQAAPFACLDPSTIPTALTGGVRPPRFAGVEACSGAVCGSASLAGVPDPSVSVTTGYGLELLPAGAPERTLGAQAQVVAFAIDATPAELAGPGGAACPATAILTNLASLWGAREHVLSVKRIPIHGPDNRDAPNRNPSVDGISIGGVTLDPAAATTLAAAAELEVAPVVPSGPAGQPEVFTKYDAAGVAVETLTEGWVYSWFATAGELKELHTRGAADTDRWDLRGVGGRVRVAVVVRDLRDGTSWALRDVIVAP